MRFHHCHNKVVNFRTTEPSDQSQEGVDIILQLNMKWLFEENKEQNRNKCTKNEDCIKKNQCCMSQKQN